MKRIGRLALRCVGLPEDDLRLQAEQRARVLIDRQAVFRVVGHAVDQRLVAGDHGVREGAGHVCDAPVDPVVWDAGFDDVASQLGEDVVGPQWPVCLGFGEPEQGVAQVGGVQRAGVEQRGKGHDRSASPGPLGCGGGVVQIVVLGLGGHLVECLAALAAGAVAVVEDVAEHDAPMPASHGVGDLAVG
jgi:hypothetical protein